MTPFGVRRPKPRDGCTLSQIARNASAVALSVRFSNRLLGHVR
jgi:hypothetical protein